MEEFSNLLDLPYLQRNWKSYKLGNGFGNSYKKIGKGSRDSIGRVINVYMNLDASARLKWIKNDKDEWDRVTSFYYGVLVFCYERIKDKLSFVPMKQKKMNVKIRKCMVNLEFPDWSEDLLEEVWNRKYDFNEYLDFLETVPGLSFNADSAKLVYRLQGDDAIFGILGQIYTDAGQVKKINIDLIPNLPIISVPEVSDFVSGCFFPVVVSRFSDKLRWKELDTGIFLFNEFDEVIDCAKVGQYTCAFDGLFNRLSFCGSSGSLGEFLVCWNWGEVVEAVGHFKGDVLIRNLGENLFNYDWHRFGVGGELCVYCFKGKIGGKLNRIGRTPSKLLKQPFIYKIKDEKECKIVCDLLGNFIRFETNERVVFANDELEDWFELGQLCLDQLI